MAVPSDYAVSITIAGNDVTGNVPFDSMSFEDYARQVSSFKLTVENPTVAPARGDVIVIRAINLTGSPIIFNGYIIELTSKKRDNGITKIYECDCADRKIRLQKSLIGYNTFTGSDFDIIGDLFANAYPDLSELFDFESGITPFADELSLTTDEDSLLDALNELADLSGAEYKLDNTGTGLTNTLVTFDTGGSSNYTVSHSDMAGVETTGGNGGNCYQGTTNTPATTDYIQVQIDLSAQTVIKDFTFDLYASIPGSASTIGWKLLIDGQDGGLTTTVGSMVTGGVWTSYSILDKIGQDRKPLVANSSIAIRIGISTATAGNYDLRIDNVGLTVATGYDLVDFDSGDTYTTGSSNMDTAAVTTGGNSGNCFKCTRAVTSGVTTGHYMTVTRDTGAEQLMYGVGMHYEITTVGSGTVRAKYEILDSADVVVSSGTMTGSLQADSNWYIRGEWFTTPVMGQKAVLKLERTIAPSSNGTDDFRMDNVFVILADKDIVEWDDTPEAADFDLDIANSDEYAFDIDLTEGDFEDFNSVTVIGGYELVAIDWTYALDGAQDHIGLETPVTDLAVYKNTGTDTTPSWTAQTVGAWGSDTLTGDGGTKDVLYDAQDHWLYFDTEPGNLTKSIRITGSIQRPIRVRVENITAGDPTFATAYGNDKIVTIDQAVAVGQSWLEKKNSIKRLEFTTFNPGLKPGQLMTVTDSARGLSESLKIQKVSTKWLGSSGHAEFRVECGDEEQSSLDAILANNDKRSRQSSGKVSPDTQTAYLLTDDSGNLLSDDNSQQLYEVY